MPVCSTEYGWLILGWCTLKTTYCRLITFGRCGLSSCRQKTTAWFCFIKSCTPATMKEAVEDLTIYQSAVAWVRWRYGVVLAGKNAALHQEPNSDNLISHFLVMLWWSGFVNTVTWNARKTGKEWVPEILHNTNMMLYGCTGLSRTVIQLLLNNTGSFAYDQRYKKMHFMQRTTPWQTILACQKERDIHWRLTMKFSRWDDVQEADESAKNINPPWQKLRLRNSLRSIMGMRKT